MPEYRISYVIESRDDAASDFTEIGFGDSGAWNSVEQASHIVNSAVQNGDWETSPGMPNPSEVQ